MSVTANSIIATPLDEVRNLLAATAQWQTDTGTASASAAKEFIYYGAVDAEDVRYPVALVAPSPAWTTGIRTGAFASGTALLGFHYLIPEEYSRLDDAEIWFNNTIGTIIEQMWVYGASPGYLHVRNIATMGEAQRSDPTDNEGAVYRQTLRIDWGLEPA